MRILTFFSCILLMVSCSSSDQNNVREQAKNTVDSLLVIANYPKEIVGDWLSNSLKIDVNADSAYQIYVAKGEWETKLRHRPIKTTFRANNTYQIDYLNLQDSIFEKRRGVWNVFGDTLLLIESESTYKYSIKMRRNHLQYQAFIDWDEDGEEDDVYSQIDEKIIKKE